MRRSVHDCRIGVLAGPPRVRCSERARATAHQACANPLPLTRGSAHCPWMAERFTPFETGPEHLGEPRESPLFFERLHRALHRWNVRRHRPEHPTRRWRDELEEDLRMRSLEGEWIEAERAVLRHWTRDVPRGPAAFLRWFEGLVDDGHSRPLLDAFNERATLDQVRWWMRQELVAEAGLDALVA